MILHSLAPQNFRNLAPEPTAFHDRTNLLVGDNGQGKTNLLEAVYFLATTKSFRTTRVASLFRFDSPSVFVAGQLFRDGIERTLSVGLGGAAGALAGGEERQRAGGASTEKRRVLMINEERVTLPAYINAMSVFAYSSARLEILRGAPEERRRFLDRGVASVSPAYLEQLGRYSRVLRQRNALLHDVGTNREAPSSLDAWDEEFESAAAAVQSARAKYAGDLAVAFAEIVKAHGYHVANVEMAYRPNVPDRELRRDEIRARMSLSGPQRDLVDFSLDGRPAAEVLSGGELKMIVLFLKFAKVELFRRRFDDAPLFLLDDIDAELDLRVLQRLLAGLPSQTQVFATSAKESFLEALRAGPHRRLVVENGRVTAARDFA